MNVTTFQALAEPKRLEIVQLLGDGPLTVGEISERLQLSQPQTSKHLRTLNEAGLVVVQPRANKRIYKLNPEPFREIDIWLETYQQIWKDKINSLEVYLKQLKVDAQDAEN
jgi:DNA-binding transcriptional ArsR family regulator